jgi:hypothetical protein
MFRSASLSLAALLVSTAAVAAPVTTSSTNFTGFTLGSVDGQGGWGVSNPAFDQAVVDDGANRVWRVSNAVVAGSFGDQPFAPRPGGIPADTVNDPDNSNPAVFAGEPSTGAANTRFFASFDIKTAVPTTQAGARITVSPDNGSGARMGFLAFRDTGSDIIIETSDPNATGGFSASQGIGTFAYGSWNTIGIELVANVGTFNDVVNYFLNGTLIHTASSWEAFYAVNQPTLHPLGVPVQTLLFRLAGTAAPSVQGGGFFIDNVITQVGEAAAVSEPASLALLGAGLLGAAALRRRRR